MKRRTFFAGDQVVVRSPEEILATLDAEGTLDGLPFMPEMLDWCGKPFRVQRRVEKTCVDAEVHLDPKRRFPAGDVVMLDNLRCDGAAHDGCKRGCRVFWKEAWLRPLDGPVATAPDSDAALAELRTRLKTKADEKRYYCQSTELLKATETFPGRQKPGSIRVALREIRNGDLSFLDIVRFFALWFTQRLRRRLAGASWLSRAAQEDAAPDVGPCGRGIGSGQEPRGNHRDAGPQEAQPGHGHLPRSPALLRRRGGGALPRRQDHRRADRDDARDHQHGRASPDTQSGEPRRRVPLLRRARRLPPAAS
jgi:hypothetical protein